MSEIYIYHLLLIWSLCSQLTVELSCISWSLVNSSNRQLVTNTHIVSRDDNEKLFTPERLKATFPPFLSENGDLLFIWNTLITARTHCVKYLFCRDFLSFGPTGSLISHVFYLNIPLYSVYSVFCMFVCFFNSFLFLCFSKFHSCEGRAPLWPEIRQISTQL